MEIMVEIVVEMGVRKSMGIVDSYGIYGGIVGGILMGMVVELQWHVAGLAIS